MAINLKVTSILARLNRHSTQLTPDTQPAGRPGRASEAPGWQVASLGDQTWQRCIYITVRPRVGLHHSDPRDLHPA